MTCHAASCSHTHCGCSSTLPCTPSCATALFIDDPATAETMRLNLHFSYLFGFRHNHYVNENVFNKILYTHSICVLKLAVSFG